MKKYFINTLDSLISTFSIVESGNIITYTIQAEHPTIINSGISIGDLILACIENRIYYNFEVTETSQTELILKKVFEIEKSIDHFIPEEGRYVEILENEYKLICSKLFSNFNNSPLPIESIDLGNLKEKFAEWLYNKGKYSRVYDGSIAVLNEKLSEYEIAYYNDFDISIFDYPKHSLETIISELEINIINDLGEIGELNKKTVGNGSVKAILGSKNYIQFLKELIIKNKISSANSPRVTGINKIYFGAPGTGKSFQITEDLKEVNKIFQERITFHPEYDNASFVGGYKPITDNKGDIKYEFVPQIFTNTYIKACNDPDHQYYIIIEEINRGNCAEIFGELFQLLDRDPKYDITPSNELINYLDNHISNKTTYKDGKMLLPDNLSILATMNTSDQSLFPMDSAFKRRWEWEYIPINYDKDVTNNRSAKYNIKMPDGSLVNWLDFIKIVNQMIQGNRNLGMDKCIGNYFIKPDKNDEITMDQFIYKVMFYLWNDVFKDEPTDSIFKGDISYQDFFPIEGKGKDLINSIFIDLKIIEEPIEETAETETEG